MTVTLKLHSASLSSSSVAVYTTVVVPTLKLVPGSCVLVKLTTVPSSVAVGATQFTMMSQASTATLLEISSGQLVIVGALEEGLFVAFGVVTLKEIKSAPPSTDRPTETSVVCPPKVNESK